MSNKDYNLDELFTELLNKAEMSDIEKEKYMNEFDEKSLSEKMVLVKLIESKVKLEREYFQTQVIDSHIKRGV